MQNIICYLALLCSSLIVLPGCKEDKPESYSVDKGIVQSTPKSSLSQPQSTPSIERDAQQFGIPQWTAPAHWDAQPLGAMRKGSWKVTQVNGGSAEITVLAFPGDVGGDLANTNRWAQQIGLDPLSIEELNEVSESVSVDGHSGRLITLTNIERETPLAIMVALVPVGEGTWFFKCMGDAAVVIAERSELLEFLQTVQF